MHAHKFSDMMLSRLQKHAVPLVDSIEDVISRALDALEKGQTNQDPPTAISTQKGGDGAKEFDPDAPPSLKHSVPKKLVVGGVEIPKDIYWNTLLREVIRAAAKKGWSSDRIAAVIQTPTKSGAFDGPGYRHVEEAKLSFQQLNSDRAWAEAYRLARNANVEIFARWVWQGKADAPSQVGIMQNLLG